MSKMEDEKLLDEIDESSTILWARMVTWLENVKDRIETLEERVKKLEDKEVRK